jgi:CRP-like cAMP-binding protein
MNVLRKAYPFSILDDNQFSTLAGLTKTKKYVKKTVMIKQGDIADHIIFLKAGIVSSLYEKDSKTFIRDFYFEPLIFTEQESFVRRVPAKFSVVSVTDVECELISFKDLEAAYNQIPQLRKVAYELLLNGFMNISNRLESLLTLNPEQRYLELLNGNPKLLHRIPLKLIASYLGVTNVALSRIRKRVSVSKIN